MARTPAASGRPREVKPADALGPDRQDQLGFAATDHDQPVAGVERQRPGNGEADVAAGQ